jgi:hypothetical protein
LQAPCADAFLLDANSEASRAIEMILDREGDAG